ncbi:MAG: cysteine--tRNA ligase [Spirochaetales bacterium]|nr:cysteine--tRNA ligase [Spirochaetales bacterium]
MEMQLYNTDGREAQTFKPIEEGKAGLYCCGPTVYNYAHIGNMRPYTIQDVLKRALTYFGYDVNHVMNITDVGHLTDDGDEGEDKMIKAAREKGMSVWDIARFFEDAFWKDLERLNISRPTVSCRATDHIQDMIDMISTLEEKGYTYISGGNVYFDTSKFPEYGKMALLDRQELKEGARVGVDENKRNYTDFVLWFTKSKFENQAMVWDSPWGKGYPGWHIECSAMSSKYLGPHFDFHCGGIDHVPVHHTNEIAQSEAANGCKWVNYWVHNEFILMKTGKMSKSKGNFLTIQSLVDEGYDALDYRYLLLGGHYRSQLVFSWESLDGARSARESLVRKIKALLEESQAAAELNEKALVYMKDFEQHLADDLNTPRCLADIWSLLKDKELGADQKLALIFKMDGLLGLKLEEEASREEEKVSLDGEIEALIEERNQARKDKNFARSDEIRDELLARGIKIIDTPQGTTWEKV